MKKRIILLIVVLIITTGLLVGCTTYPGSLEGYQYGNGGNRAAGHNEIAEAGNGYGNPAHATIDNGTRGNGNRVNGSNGIGNGGNGRGADTGNGDCIATDTYEPAAAPLTEPANSEPNTAVVTEGYGASGAIADEELSLAKMLTYAIQDEYLAHAEYATIIDSLGSARPFSNIIKAEQQHINALLPLFTEYGIEAPADTGSDYTAAVTDLTQAYHAGEKAEIDNIAMYNEFLKQDLPDDVRTVFESLHKASENHLAAFRNHL